MRGLFIAIFLVFMALRPVHAAHLPAEMLGPWCHSWGYQFPNDREADHWWRIYINYDDGGTGRVRDADECGNRGGINVRKDGYDYVRFGPRFSCEFTAIEFRRHGKPEDRLAPENGNGEIESDMMTNAPPSDVLTIRATCKTNAQDNETWNESFDIQTANDWLRTEVDEG
jgi:hypothetical protein